jgi:general secretion pathway protein G
MNKFFKNNQNQQGFTLIELLLVVILIAILSGMILSVINVSGMRNRGKDAQRSGDLKKIQTALELYFTDRRSYPINSASFATVAAALTTPLVGTYIQALPTDPREGDAKTATCGLSNYRYFYRSDGVGSRYVLMSFMETASAAATSLCGSLSNCTSGNVAGCTTCGTTCYGVQNPL